MPPDSSAGQGFLKKRLNMRSKTQAWFPRFHFQNGGRRIKIKHVIVMVVMPLSSLREFYNSGIFFVAMTFFKSSLKVDFHFDFLLRRTKASLLPSSQTCKYFYRHDPLLAFVILQATRISTCLCLNTKSREFVLLIFNVRIHASRIHAHKLCNSLKCF